MKKLFFTLLFLGFCFIALGQNEPKVGDVLIIERPSSHVYNYVKFPKLNTLTKRGKVANYKSVKGNIVVIDEIIEGKDGSTDVVLKKKDGTKFFGYLTTVKANYAKSIKAGEISIKS
ncbi:hypothetical protein [Winogradskyella sp.]|uniref:hypothetical protein n=1 Tax=Winogradskyella sp. TaxID=1883156 RepID=UPI003241A421